MIFRYNSVIKETNRKAKRKGKKPNHISKSHGNSNKKKHWTWGNGIKVQWQKTSMDKYRKVC